jgi:hypothetical protein
MQILPSKELVNLPNIALVAFSALVAVFIYYLVCKPFEENNG